MMARPTVEQLQRSDARAAFLPLAWISRRQMAELAISMEEMKCHGFEDLRSDEHPAVRLVSTALESPSSRHLGSCLSNFAALTVAPQETSPSMAAAVESDPERNSPSGDQIPTTLAAEQAALVLEQKAH